jgi:DNA-binding IclR family transcriptional regulator
MKTTKTVGLKTVQSTLDVLELLANEEHPVRLTDISERLGMPKARVHRILATLASRHYVWQEPSSRRYELGHRLWLLGSEVKAVQAMLEIIQPELSKLCEQARETVLCAIFEEFDILNLHIQRGPHPVHAFIHVGNRAPVNATATGKALLVHSSDEFLEQIFERGLKTYTEHTIVERERLIDEVEKARANGFASAVDEWVIGLSAVSAAIVDPSRLNPFGLCIVFPTSRASQERIVELGDLVKKVANGISQKLSY